MRCSILICDDEAMVRALVSAALADAYDVVEAADGSEALDRLRSARFDLIIVDMMMPGISGLELVAELRADDTLAATPVLMLTARAQATDRDAAAKGGVDRFLTKPFGLDELLDAVEQLLQSAA